MKFGRLWLALGGVYGFLGVVLGAVGAHDLRGQLSPEMVAVWHTAVAYQFYHSLALLALGVLAICRPTAGQTLSGIGFSLGITLFSGSLYLICLGGATVWGTLTPAGGLLLLLGWAALIWSSWRG